MDIWNVKSTIRLNIDDYKDIINKPLYLTENISNYNELEKYVYEIALFHLKRLQYENNVEIEYSLKSLDDFINNYNCDDDSIFTSLTFISPNDNPIILTNMNYEMYTYKDINDDANILFIFPEELKNIFIEPNKHFYRYCKLFNDDDSHDNVQLIVRIFEKKSSNINLLLEDSNYINTLVFSNYDKTDITVKNDIMNKEILEDILYNTEKTHFDNIKHHFENELKLNRTFLTNLLKIENTTSDNNETIKLQVKLDPRFIQRRVVNNFYNGDVCDWICKEIKNNLNINDTFKIKNKIEIDKLPAVLSFFINSYPNIIENIKKTYSLNNGITYNIRELFVESHEDNENDEEIIMKNDKSDITFKILLNDKPNYDNNGLLFEDNIITYLNKGDMIIYNGFVKYKETAIKKGVKIYLVGYFDLFINKKEEWWVKEVKD